MVFSNPHYVGKYIERETYLFWEGLFLWGWFKCRERSFCEGEGLGRKANFLKYIRNDNPSAIFRVNGNMS